MAVLASNSWLKLLIRMQMTKTFGPQFKMIIVMFGDLIEFIFFWACILLLFTSVAGLIFGSVSVYFS